jgi:hypothetical protein
MRLPSSQISLIFLFNHSHQPRVVSFTDGNEYGIHSFVGCAMENLMRCLVKGSAARCLRFTK